MAAALSAMFLMTGKKLKTAPLKIIPENVDVQVKNVVYTDVGAEGTKWELIADTGTYLKKENKALFDRVRVKLVLSDGQTMLMTGDKGIFGTESKNVDISGHVVIITDKGDRITMDELHYTDADKTFRTDSKVFHENNRMKLEGKGMNLSLITREMKLMSAVKAFIKPNK